jgi:hypothetical protein
MFTNNYLPILTNSTSKNFFSYFDALDIPQIDYFAIGIQNQKTKKSISLMSSAEWQKQFYENNYADGDPIRKATLYTKRNIISFCEIDFVDNFGKEIMHQRSKMGINKGIIFMQRQENINYMITLGTGYSCFDSFDFIKRYHDKINVIKNDFINLVQRDSLEFMGTRIEA